MCDVLVSAIFALRWILKVQNLQAAVIVKERIYAPI
jgi:hypothetical protein